MKFGMKFGMVGGASAGLVIKTKEVVLLAMQGRTVQARVRVPLDGREDHHLVQAVQQALASSGLTTKRLAVSIPSQDILLRFFTIPAVPKAELEAAVQFEARKYIPFKTELLVWDCRAMPAGANRLEVIFAGIPREMFRRFQEVLAAAGVEPTLIEPRSMSLSRLVPQVKGAAANEFVCLVDIEGDAAHLAIVRNRLPYLMRDLNLQASAGGSAVSPGPQSPGGVIGGGEAAAAVDPRAQRLLSELSVSIDFFIREYPSTTISRVFLCGEEGLVGPWCRWLSDQLHCSVTLASAFTEARAHGELPLSFASALGLLQGAREPGGGLDFLKRSLVQVKGTQPRAAIPPLTISELLRTPAATASGVVAAVLVAALWASGKRAVDQEAHRLDELISSRPAAGLGLAQMPLDQLQPLHEKATAQLEWLKQVVGDRVRVAAKLDALARSLPDGVWLTGLDFENPLTARGKSESRLTVTGACYIGEPSQELGAIQQFEAEIKRNPAFLSGFSAAQLDQINVQMKSRYDAVANRQEQYPYRTFQLTCHPVRQL